MIVVKQLRLLLSCSALLLLAAGCGDTASTQGAGASQAIPNSTHTRIGTLTYEAGFPTPDTVRKLYDELDFQRAVLAHQISDNLVSFYSMYVGPQEAIEGARMGDLVVWENFLDPKGIVLTGNDTTVYGMAYLDLKRNGPMVVEVPRRRSSEAYSTSGRSLSSASTPRVASSWLPPKTTRARSRSLRA